MHQCVQILKWVFIQGVMTSGNILYIVTLKRKAASQEPNKPRLMVKKKSTQYHNHDSLLVREWVGDNVPVTFTNISVTLMSIALATWNLYIASLVAINWNISTTKLSDTCILHTWFFFSNSKGKRSSPLYTGIWQSPIHQLSVTARTLELVNLSCSILWLWNMCGSHASLLQWDLPRSDLSQHRREFLLFPKWLELAATRVLNYFQPESTWSGISVLRFNKRGKSSNSKAGNVLANSFVSYNYLANTKSPILSENSSSWQGYLP